MPRYFFHVENGDLVKDEQGADLPNLEAVRNKAAMLLGELLKNAPDMFWADQSLRVIVTDDRQLIILTVDAVATTSPSVARPASP